MYSKSENKNGTFPGKNIKNYLRKLNLTGGYELLLIIYF